MKKSSLVAGLIILATINVSKAQRDQYPAQSDPCISGATPWVLGGNNLIYPSQVSPTTPPLENNIGTCNAYDFILKANNIQSMFITTTGNVGVGAFPAANCKFDVTNASNFRIYADATGHLESTTDVNMHFATGGVFRVNEGPVNNASNLLTIASGGNVGLGTGVPQTMIHLDRNGDADIRLQSHAASGKKWDLVSASGWGTVSGGHFGIVDANSNTIRLDISPSGNIGINNPLPVAALDIKGTSNAGNIKIFGDQFGTIESVGDMSLRFNSLSDFVIGPSGSSNEYFTIKNGNVGINEVAPNEKLDVNGNVRVQGNLGVGAFPAQEKLHVAGGNMRVDGKGAFGCAPGSENLIIYDPNAAVLKVHTGALSPAKIEVANSSFGYNLNIDATQPQPIGHISTGNAPTVDLINFQPVAWPQHPQVWIGRKPTTTHTDFHFAVDGKIVAHSMYLTLNCGWADYVFAPEYQLPKLEDVEAFYKINQHLPEIPSAKEVEENGIGVAEMNVLLLKKVEELTLYLVEQQKEINKLKMNQRQN
jgi:hypothetical protein